jgi:adenosine/AMP kinase
VTVNLSSPNISSTLRGQIKSAGVGDWFRITNMKKAFVYDDVNLIIVGYSETIDPFVHSITFNCMPAEPYTVAVYDTARYDADGSTLTSNVTSTATSISATNTTTVWTTDATMFPFDIAVGGERMTVTNITGATTPQTMTVTRSVNGVVKAQTAGTEIVLWDTPRYAL